MNIVDFFINTICDMPDEKDFFYHYNEFENVQGSEIVFQKIFGALLVLVFLDNIVCSNLIDY